MFYVFLIIAIIITGSMAYAAHKGAPWVPTWKKDTERTKQLMNLQGGERVYELGCGDARVLLALATSVGSDKKPVEAVGIELSLLPYLAAKLRCAIVRPKHSKIMFGNLFKKDLSDADAVYLFLMPEVYERIRPKLEVELRPGTHVVSYVWPIPGWEPQEVSVEEGRSKLYLYVMK